MPIATYIYITEIKLEYRWEYADIVRVKGQINMDA